MQCLVAHSNKRSPQESWELTRVDSRLRQGPSPTYMPRHIPTIDVLSTLYIDIGNDQHSA